MRRATQEITDKTEIEKIIRKATICHVGLCDGNIPYVFPVNFGFKDDTVYIHSATEGRKLDIIKNNTNACVEFVGMDELVRDEQACDWSAKYESVIAEGKAVIVEDTAGKIEALKILMAQYTDRNFQFGQKEVDRVAIIKIDLHKVIGKKSKNLI